MKSREFYTTVRWENKICRHSRTMKGEKAVAKPKAADSVKSLNIVGSRFFGRHIGFKIYDNSRNLNAGPASRPDVTNLKTIFGGIYMAIQLHGKC